MAGLPIVILLSGASAMWLARKRTVRFNWTVALGAGVLTWLASVLISTRIPLQTNISVWRPIDLFAAQIELRFDDISAPVIIATATVLVAVVLSSSVRLADRSFRLGAVTLVYGALGMAAILSGNLLTVALSWALMDLTTLLHGIGIAKEPMSMSSLLVRVIVDACGIFAVVGAAIVNDAAGGTGDLGTPLADNRAMAIVVIAVVLRLGLVRSEYSLAGLPGMERTQAALVEVLPPAAALMLAARQFAHGVPAELTVWLQGGSAVGMLISGARWLLGDEGPDRQRFFTFGVAFLGLAVSSVLDVGFEGPLVSAILIVLIVGGIHAIGRVYSPWHRMFPMLGAAIMILPAWSAGARLVGGLAGALVLGGKLWIAVVGVLGLGMLVAGVARGAFRGMEVWYVDDLARLLFAVSLLLPVLVGLGLGGTVDLAGIARAFVVALLASGAAAGFFALGRRVDRKMWEGARRRLDRLQMRPALRVVGDGLHWMSGTMRGIGGILEGEGAMLWVFVIVLMIELVTAGGSR